MTPDWQDIQALVRKWLLDAAAAEALQIAAMREGLRSGADINCAKMLTLRACAAQLEALQPVQEPSDVE